MLLSTMRTAFPTIRQLPWLPTEKPTQECVARCSAASEDQVKRGRLDNPREENRPLKRTCHGEAQ